MSFDSDDETWHETYPKNVSLLLNPVEGGVGALLRMTTETKLPFPYRSKKIYSKTFSFYYFQTNSHAKHSIPDANEN